jgi:fumarate reductase subunit D
MAIANKALVWALFAAGGTLTALLFPALIALFLLVSAGHVPPGLEFGPIQAFAASWLGRIVLFVIISLSVWHAAHRLRVLAHDFGIRADGPVAMVLYALAGAATLLAGILLALIRPA